MEAKKFIIRGKVQGVYFRKYTQNQARTLGLAGWVRNRADGSVECLAQGSLEKLSLFEKWLWTGSPASLVGAVRSEEAEVEKNDDFEILDSI